MENILGDLEVAILEREYVGAHFDKSLIYDGYLGKSLFEIPAPARVHVANEKCAKEVENHDLHNRQEL